MQGHRMLTLLCGVLAFSGGAGAAWNEEWAARKPLRIDILTGLSGVTWKEVWDGHLEVTLDGLTLPVIGRKELIANKRAAGRPKDLLDLALLARTKPRKP